MKHIKLRMIQFVRRLAHGRRKLAIFCFTDGGDCPVSQLMQTLVDAFCFLFAKFRQADMNDFPFLLRHIHADGFHLVLKLVFFMAADKAKCNL